MAIAAAKSGRPIAAGRKRWSSATQRKPCSMPESPSGPADIPGQPDAAFVAAVAARKQFPTARRPRRSICVPPTSPSRPIRARFGRADEPPPFARRADPARVARIHARCFAEPWDMAATLATPGSFALIAEEAWVSCCAASAADECEILSIGVAPESRGHGLGTRLLAAAIERGPNPRRGADVPGSGRETTPPPARSTPRGAFAERGAANRILRGRDRCPGLGFKSLIRLADAQAMRIAFGLDRQHPHGRALRPNGARWPTVRRRSEGSRQSGPVPCGRSADAS